MFRRFDALKRACLLLCILLAAPGQAWAHRLEAEATVRSFGVVQVEAWFETGDIPKSAQVQVFGADERKLAEGTLDEQGSFTFTYTDPEPLRVVVDAGIGHRVEVKIKKTELERGEPTTQSAETLRETGPQVERLVLGVGMLLALAGGMILLRKRRYASDPRELFSPESPMEDSHGDR